MSARLLVENLDRLGEDERDELLSGMQGSAGRLQRLLGDLLTTSRLQAATLALDVQDHDVAEVLGPVLQRLRVAHPEATIDVQVPDGLLARVDADRLGQIVDNLVANAVAYGKSPIRVSAVVAGPEVEITVRDAGPGVPAELRDRLFERFATRGGHGSGLGLHIVRELARAQGGEASYRAEQNAFVICIPATTTAP
jgi:signal transduction histidine kinase